MGYLANVKSTTYTDQNSNEFAALLMFFIGEDGTWGKGYFPYQPYFCLLVEEECIRELIFLLNKEYAEYLDSIDVVDKEDLGLINHLSGKTQKYIKLKFRNVSLLQNCKEKLMPIIKRNKAEKETRDAYEGWYNQADRVDQ